MNGTETSIRPHFHSVTKIIYKAHFHNFATNGNGTKKWKTRKSRRNHFFVVHLLMCNVAAHQKTNTQKFNDGMNHHTCKARLIKKNMISSSLKTVAIYRFVRCKHSRKNVSEKTGKYMNSTLWNQSKLVCHVWQEETWSASWFRSMWPNNKST